MTKVKTMAVLSTTVLAALGLVACGNNANKVLEQALPKVSFNVTELAGSKDVARVVTVDDASVNVTWKASDTRISITEKNETLWTITPEIPAYGAEDYTFNLTATLEYDGATTTKEWKDILVKASTVDPSTIKEYATVSALFEGYKNKEFAMQQTGDLLKVTGVVGEIIYYNDKPDGFYLTDGAKSILVYGGLKDEVYEIGDKVEVSGKLTNYGSILQFNYQKKDDYSTSIKKVGTGTERLPASVESTVKALTEINGETGYDKYGLYYTITATVAKDASQSYPYQLTDADTTNFLTLYTNSMMSTSTDAVAAMVGKKVKLDILYYGSNSGGSYRALFLGGAEDITEVQMTDEEKVAGALAQAETLFATEYTENAEVELPATLGDAALTWTVETDSEGVVIEENKAKITQADAVQTGKIKVEADVNGKKASKVISFTIASSRPPLASINTILENEEVKALATDNQKTPSTFAAAGIVKEITTDYSEQFNNISFTLTDGTKDLAVYRMKGGETLKAGDFIAVSGKMSIYKGNLQMAQGCEEVTSYINNASQIIELSKDLAAGAFLPGNYFIHGEIKTIDTAYSEEFKNISFTITDGTKDLIVFRMKGEGAAALKVGDHVVVDAQIQNYKNKDESTTLEAVKGNLITTIVTPAA